jgi:hypothetical protein
MCDIATIHIRYICKSTKQVTPKHTHGLASNKKLGKCLQVEVPSVLAQKHQQAKNHLDAS